MSTRTPTLQAPPRPPDTTPGPRGGCLVQTAPRLLIEDAPQSPRLVPLRSNLWMVLGSAAAAEVTLQGASVPALWARLHFDGDVVTLEPIETHPPMSLEGKRVRGSTLWPPGARLSLGGCCITLLGPHAPPDPTHDTRTLREHLEATERRVIQHALHTCDHNQSRAARVLGISRRALIYKLERFGLKSAPNSEPPSGPEE